MNVRVVSGAEPFAFDGGPVGILLLHGFTANPSGLRPMGAWLSEKGYAVACPRLPGHGTTWQDLGRMKWEDWVDEAERAFRALAERVDSVIVAGVSLGGGLALLLGSRHPDRIRGVVAVNPYVRDRRIVGAPILRPFVRSTKGIGNDIAKPGQDELPYERIPVTGLIQLNRLLKVFHEALPEMRLPLLILHSPQDHVVPKGNAEYILERVGSDDTELALLPNSYHVAWLDHDADTIFERIHGFAATKAGVSR